MSAADYMLCVGICIGITEGIGALLICEAGCAALEYMEAN